MPRSGEKIGPFSATAVICVALATCPIWVLVVSTNGGFALDRDAFDLFRHFELQVDGKRAIGADDEARPLSGRNPGLRPGDRSAHGEAGNGIESLGIRAGAGARPLSRIAMSLNDAEFEPNSFMCPAGTRDRGGH